MHTHPTLSLDTDGLRITVTYDGTDAYDRMRAYTWSAYDVGADDPAQPIATSTFRTGSKIDLPRALRIAVSYCAVGSDHSPQPEELRPVNPETFARMLTALGERIPDALAVRVDHVTAGRGAAPLLVPTTGLPSWFPPLDRAGD